MSKQPTKKNAFIVLFILIIVAAVVSIVRYQLGKTRFNDGLANGNTAGNLYNAGLFCERGDMIYFSNPSDNHKLYSMTSQGTNVKKLSDDTVSYINADDHYIYYVRNNSSKDSAFSFLKWNDNSLCRIKKGGGDVTILDQDPSLYASLVGNYIYYIHYDKQDASSLYKVKIDGKEKQQVSTHPYLTCSTNGSYIYYNGIEKDHNIYRLDTASDSAVSIFEGNCYQPVIDGSTAYYLDADNNYALTLADLSTGETEVITNDRVDTFNVYGSVIYYQRNDKNNPALCRIGTDGSGQEEVCPGNFTDINITSSYVYFYPYDNDKTCYRTPLNGPVNVSQFIAAVK